MYNLQLRTDPISHVELVNQQLVLNLYVQILALILDLSRVHLELQIYKKY
jgi:hypothetical protein